MRRGREEEEEEAEVKVATAEVFPAWIVLIEKKGEGAVCLLGAGRGERMETEGEISWQSR